MCLEMCICSICIYKALSVMAFNLLMKSQNVATEKNQPLCKFPH